jgi:glycosyltransferase involved in cell wall biosynthesis
MNPATGTCPRVRQARVVLVGTYARDHFLSMQKFATLMRDELASRGVPVTLCTPPTVFGRLCPSRWTLGKWLGYIDKYLIFPLMLMFQARSAAVVHICDHSNANYAHVLARSHPVLITCHDLLAIRGAQGEDTDCRPSFTGRILQRWILSGLRLAQCVACVSTFTRDDARRVIGSRPDARLPVVLNGLNHPYQRISEEAAYERLATWRTALQARPFVFQVGSNHARKNRLGVLRAFAEFSRQCDASLVLAGQPLDQEALQLADELGVRGRIIDIGRTSNEVIEALYNRAHALLFPSHHEGFGWPLIEAQACGCPVVCSDIVPFQEVAGTSALMCPGDDAPALARCLLGLLDRDNRETVVRAGLKNAERFTTARMIDDYQALYASLERDARAVDGVLA